MDPSNIIILLVNSHKFWCVWGFLATFLTFGTASVIQAPGAEGEAAADANGHVKEDPRQLGPRPENLMPRTGGVAAAADGAADGIYRPPKLNPAAMQVAIAVLHCSSSWL